MQNHRHESNNRLIELLKTGDREAFAEIYERYWALLFRHALGMLKDEDGAKDVVQDVFTMLWEKAPTLEVHTSLSSFLYTSVRYAVLKRFRHSKVVDNYLSTLNDIMLQGVESTDMYVNEKELSKKIEQELNMLPPKMRRVFELSRIHEYSYREISDELGLADNTVKRQVSNALKILRTRLQIILFIFF